MRIHLGHHFYGAGNLGDDFMLAGFLTAMRSLAPAATFSACVPFPLAPLAARFPEVRWKPYDEANRAACIDACDAWLGLGGSPFQSALSRWFVDHLIGDQRLCSRHGKPMYFLGVGVQGTNELAVPEIGSLCRTAVAIWTRDRRSAERIDDIAQPGAVHAASDLAHIFFSSVPPPRARERRLTLVANFDYGDWPGAEACFETIDRLNPGERVWLAQESRELPGAEKTLFAALPEAEKSKWRLVAPDEPGAPLDQVLGRWPTGEWLITARYHAAIAGVWAGSKVTIIATNEKLRGLAAELGLPSIAPDADANTAYDAIARAAVVTLPVKGADLAFQACREFIDAVRAA